MMQQESMGPDDRPENDHVERGESLSEIASEDSYRFGDETNQGEGVVGDLPETLR